MVKSLSGLYSLFRCHLNSGLNIGQIYGFFVQFYTGFWRMSQKLDPRVSGFRMPFKKTDQILASCTSHGDQSKVDITIQTPDTNLFGFRVLRLPVFYVHWRIILPGPIFGWWESLLLLLKLDRRRLLLLLPVLLTPWQAQLKCPKF